MTAAANSEYCWCQHYIFPQYATQYTMMEEMECFL